MNKTLCDNWNGFSASIPGSGHIRKGLPCQDASATFTSPRPALIVCDGRGSASRSQDGAQAAVKTFRSQAAVFEPMLTTVLDGETEHPEQWMMFSRIMYRTLMQVKLDLSAKQGIPEKEFDFTVAFAVVGTRRIGCFQVGDGAIVLRQNDICTTAFPPDKGEFANQTHFLRENGETIGKFHAALFSAVENTGIAITSDGPEHLMFKLPNMEPGRIFNQMMTDLHDQNLTQQDLMDYLTRPNWNNDPRGADDRSIAILAPVSCPQTDKATESIVTETSPAEPPAAAIKPPVVPETAAIKPSVMPAATAIKPSVVPETDAVPPKPMEQKPVAIIQNTATNRPNETTKPSTEILAKPAPLQRPTITFVCDIRMFRILCLISSLTICLIAAIGINLVKQMEELKSTAIASNQALASLPETMETEEVYEPELTQDQEVEVSEVISVLEETAMKQEQPPEPQNMPIIQKAETKDQPQKPEIQEEVIKPQDPVIHELTPKKDDSIIVTHDTKPPIENEAAPVNIPPVQVPTEHQKQME